MGIFDQKVVVEVWHPDHESGKLRQVAQFRVEPSLDSRDNPFHWWELFAEYGFRWTQNIQDSWSGAAENSFVDVSPCLTLIQRLGVYKGRPLGHRSSMVGDFITVRHNDKYVELTVHTVGFQEVRP